MTLYRIDAGSADGVEVRNIVGAVTHEAGLRNRFIGQIRIHPDHSTIELPDDLPPAMIEHLKKVYVGGKAMKMERASGGQGAGPEARHERPPRGRPKQSGAEAAGAPKPGKAKADKAKAGKAKPGKAKPGKAKPGKDEARPRKPDKRRV
jgi:ATP-dependent RNA helicase DeaD